MTISAMPLEFYIFSEINFKTLLHTCLFDWGIRVFLTQVPTCSDGTPCLCIFFFISFGSLSLTNSLAFYSIFLFLCNVYNFLIRLCFNLIKNWRTIGIITSNCLKVFKLVFPSQYNYTLFHYITLLLIFFISLYSSSLFKIQPL